MNSTQLGWTAFLVAIASVTTTTPAPALTSETQPLDQNPQPTGIEGRIARIQSTLQTITDHSPTDLTTSDPQKLALGWGNGRGGGGTFVNSRRGGWGDGRGGGGFVNVNPWRNGWSDGGGFYNRRWPDGGSFINRW